MGNEHALFSGLFDGTTDAVRFDGPSSFVGDIERLVEPIEVPELAVSDEVAESTLDAELDTAASESQPEPSPRQADETAALHSVSALSQGASPVSSDRPAGSDGQAVAQLFASMQVTRTPEGGMRIEAPPEAAAALSQLLVGLAELLRAAEPPRE